MRLLTLTRLWLFGRYLYSVGDLRLWTPIPHRALGYGLAVFVPVWLLLALPGVGFGGPGLTWHFVVPGLTVWWLLRMVGEGQRPTEAVSSWGRLLWHAARTPAVRPVALKERRGRRG
jgi:hypothetical protein